MTSIFNDNFARLDSSAIADALKEKGVFSMENILSSAWIEALQADVDRHPFAINANWITGVYAEDQYYLTHMLACSRSFYDYVTHPAVFSVCDRVLGESYRLKAMRYYETYGRHHMQWHTDNKTDRGFAHIPGLIFILYLSDVADGEFQYVRGSNNWSGDKAYSDYSDVFIHDNYRGDILSFKGPKGTLVIYDTYGIHRAKPVPDKSFVRKSLFFQVDSKTDSGEPLLLNPSFVPMDKGIDAKLATYLGFGRPSEYNVFPNTTLRNLQLRRLNASVIVSWIAQRTGRGGYNLLPHAIKNRIRKLTGRSVI